MKAKNAAAPLEKGKAVVRFNPRFPEPVARQLREASALRGLSIANFIVEAVAKETERVFDEETRWKLTLAESGKIQKLLAKPPAINAAAKKAAKDLAENVRIRS